jgi:hypothetical protein
MSSRRGFLGGFLATLGGLVLARKIGPIEIEGPSQEVWKAAPALPTHPRTNEFVTLQQMIAETVRIVDQETQWLRLKRVHDNGGPQWDWRRGDVLNVRPPVVFTGPLDFDLDAPHRQILETYIPVPIVQQARARMTFEPDEVRGRSLPEFSKIHVRPAALALAEDVIQLIRRNGGGEYLVTVDQNVEIPGIPRAAMVLGQAEQLSIRGVHLPPMPPDGRRDPHQQIVELDMLFGLGSRA